VRAVSFDISLRKQAELELQRQQREVAHLSRVVMLGELSGALAHELNQPLTAILSNAQAATRFMDQAPADLEEVYAILGDITGEARRAGEVIRRLRQLLSTGEVQRQPVDLQAMLAETLHLLRSDLMSQQVIMTVTIEQGMPAIPGDRVQLQQVVINLVMNACDAMKNLPPADRRLLVKADLSKQGEVMVSFVDRGCGLPPNAADKVFDSFYSTKPNGMGLGLSVCRTIMIAHQGRIWAENNLPRGASFHFTLPTHPAGEGAHP
jgi:C4-dicarboxylate-specific signal transduction histidine kinase